MKKIFVLEFGFLGRLKKFWSFIGGKNKWSDFINELNCICLLKLDNVIDILYEEDVGLVMFL